MPTIPGVGKEFTLADVTGKRKILYDKFLSCLGPAATPRLSVFMALNNNEIKWLNEITDRDYSRIDYVLCDSNFSPLAHWLGEKYFVTLQYQAGASEDDDDIPRPDFETSSMETQNDLSIGGEITRSVEGSIRAGLKDAIDRRISQLHTTTEQRLLLSAINLYSSQSQFEINPETGLENIKLNLTYDDDDLLLIFNESRGHLQRFFQTAKESLNKEERDEARSLFVKKVQEERKSLMIQLFGKGNMEFHKTKLFKVVETVLKGRQRARLSYRPTYRQIDYLMARNLANLPLLVELPSVLLNAAGSLNKGEILASPQHVQQNVSSTLEPSVDSNKNKANNFRAKIVDLREDSSNNSQKLPGIKLKQGSVIEQLDILKARYSAIHKTSQAEYRPEKRQAVEAAINAINEKGLDSPEAMKVLSEMKSIVNQRVKDGKKPGEYINQTTGMPVEAGLYPGLHNLGEAGRKLIESIIDSLKKCFSSTEGECGTMRASPGD